MESKRQYAVLGLGIFGSTVSKTLSKYDCDVIAIDRDMDCVQRVADFVHVAIQGDITDINVLRDAGVADCDVAVIATGSHLEESLLCIMQLKELGIPVIVAKAKNKVHKQILEKMGVDKVVRPEKEMGVQLAKTILSSHIIDTKDLDDEYSIVEVAVPKSWVGKTLLELDVRNRYHLNILGIRYESFHLDVNPSPNHRFTDKEHLLFISTSTNITKLEFIDK